MSAKNEHVAKIDDYLIWLDIIVFHSGWSRHALVMISNYLDERNRIFEEANSRQDWNNPDANQYGETERGLTCLAFCACQLQINSVTSLLMKILKELQELSPKISNDLSIEGRGFPDSKEKMRKRDVVVINDQNVFRVEEIYQLANYAKHRSEWSENMCQEMSNKNKKSNQQEKTWSIVRDLVMDEYWGEAIQQSWPRFDINQPSEMIKLFGIIDEWSIALHNDFWKIWNDPRISYRNK